MVHFGWFVSRRGHTAADQSWDLPRLLLPPKPVHYPDSSALLDPYLSPVMAVAILGGLDPHLLSNTKVGIALQLVE